MLFNYSTGDIGTSVEHWWKDNHGITEEVKEKPFPVSLSTP